MIKRITAKFGSMRKAVDWVVYPAAADAKELTIQCDRRIARFDTETGKGIMSKSMNYAGFAALSMPGAEAIQLTQDQINTCKGIIPQSGTEIGGGVYVA